MGEGERRRLAAIMFTDMVGFTALTQTDEARALRLLDRHNRLLRPLFPQFHGTEVKSIGDSFLVEFESALEAVRCAIQIQDRLEEHNATADELSQVQVRIGVHLGDVVHSHEDVFGDAVNLASRIEPLAEPGGICVTDPVFAQVRNKIDAAFERLPSSHLKNIRFPVEVYKVERRHVASVADGGPPTPESPHRLAVLPFSNMSPDPQDEYFADGLTEELISEMTRIPNCQVIARTSVMRYKAAPKGIKEIGRELAADVALEGSVRKSGQRIRITAQLIDTKSEAHLWTDRFDRDVGEIFDLQSEIATRVATALQVELAPGDRTHVARGGTRNLAAYEHYLRGMQCWWQAGEQNYRNAILHFEAAIKLDPGFALAYCGLADTHAIMGNHALVPLQPALDLAEKYSRKAMELVPNLADAHVSLAPVLYNRYDWAGAEAELRKAVALDPNNVLGHYWLAVAIAVRGKLDEALAESRKAAALDPMSRQQVLAPSVFLYTKGDYAGALAYLDEVEARLGFRSDLYRGLCEVLLGKVEVGLALVRKATSGEFEGVPGRRVMLGAACARAGRMEEAEQVLAALEEDGRNGRAPAGSVAALAAAIGQNDRAFEWYDRAYRDRTVLGVEDLRVDPLLAPIRSDPRFPELLRKFNLDR